MSRCYWTIRYYFNPQYLLIFIFLIIFLFVTVTMKMRIEQDERTERLRKLYLDEYTFENDAQTVGYTIGKDYKINYNFQYTSERPKIAILTIVRDREHIKDYDLAMSTVKCYAKIHGYHYILAVESDFNCHQVDEYFPRHCIAAKFARDFEATLFLDADMGVVDPTRRIEDFLFDGFDLTFYDRFYNWEIMAGSYIVRNTSYGIKFLEDFSEYGATLPDSFHGTDNGAIHFFIAERVFPNERDAIENCRMVYNTSRNFDDVFTYEACLRSIFGAHTDLGRIKLLKKGAGWARDGWLSNSVWNRDAGDFILHGMKNHNIREIPSGQSEVEIRRVPMEHWFYPLVGRIDLGKCHSRNMTWNYDMRLIGDNTKLRDHFDKLRTKIVKDQFLSFARIGRFI